MRHGIILTVIVVGIIGSILFFGQYEYSNTQHRPQDNKDALSTTPQVSPYEGSVSSAIFIPYWDIPSSSDVVEYDEVIYFGVAPDENGDLIQDVGFKNVESFIENTSPQQDRLLTLRMLDEEVSLDILGGDSRQRAVVRNVFDLAKEYGFDGIVLDLELGVIPFEDTKQDITMFVSKFSYEASEQGLSFGMTIYGDTFYRGRPYDVSALSEHVNQMHIMAYDFHKSRGEPGPNFPLTVRGSNKGDIEYDYSFQQMISDFSAVVPRENIRVIFGMYGYDWTLGKQGLPLKAATAISLKEIEEGYGDCIVIPDSDRGSMDSRFRGNDRCYLIENVSSHEKQITYTDDEGYEHVLWYEDIESAQVKIDYLKEQGIGSVGYWVWGYF